MERKDFIKNSVGFLGMALLAPSLLRSENNGATASCTVTNSETAGPFPTITPATLVQNNIVGDRTGIPLSINITVRNTNNNCAPLQGAIVDIWHCDKDGYYSEYGGTQMQSVDYTAYHFLRGRQTTDSNGLVTYTSIFPGWYQSRATHIHVHIYDASGNSLLITQIAFPEGSNSAVVQVNSATSYGYTKGMNGYTYNASDNVFSDGTSNELCAVSGSTSAGFVLTHEIYVAGSAGTATGLQNDRAESQFSVGQNYPNPFDVQTTLPVTLYEPSSVVLQFYGMEGRKCGEIAKKSLAAGEHKLLIDTHAMSMNSGKQLMIVEITNSMGTFRQSKLLLKN
jgi:protocatechuate 3,4-dioxygenase beta subunit